jgi:hypothetical protein
MSFDVQLVSVLMCIAVAFFAGYHVGTKHTVINHTSNYPGNIEKLIINGVVNQPARQDTIESAPQQTTQQGTQAAKEKDAASGHC